MNRAANKSAIPVRPVAGIRERRDWIECDQSH
jgi:hypothetical protein